MSRCGTCGDEIKPDALTGTTCKCAAGFRLLAFTVSTDDGDLVTAEGYRLSYGGTPSCWRVKPEDFPAHQAPMLHVEPTVEQVLAVFEELATAERKSGDGRALRLVQRYAPLVRSRLASP